MRYKLPDDTVIYGQDATELVDAMAQRKLAEPRSRAAYRRATARRIAWDGPKIRTDTDDNFIDDLISEGILTKTRSS